MIDDASHHYEPTKTCLNAVLPYVRPGGLYIIEDWSWAHSSQEAFQRPDGIWHDQPALTNLIIELIMLCGTRPEYVSHVAVNCNSCFIRRGTGQYFPPEFDIAKMYLARGRQFVPWL